MTKNLTDSELDALLRDGVVGRDPADQEQAFAVTWSRLQAEVDDRTPRPQDTARRRLALIGDREAAARRKRHVTRSTSIALMVVLAGSGTAAAAAFLSTRTGIYNSDREALTGGTGENLNMGGTDRLLVFAEVTADIPFPQGYYEQRTWAIESQFPYEAEVRISEGTLRSWVAGYAVCTWADSWVAADNGGDIAGKDAATVGLKDAASSKDIVDNDFAEGTILETGEVLSYRWWVQPLADAAADDNRAALLDVVARSGGCPHEVIPVIDASPDYIYAGVR